MLEKLKGRSVRQNERLARLLLVTREETEFSRAGRFQGGVDVPLTESACARAASEWPGAGRDGTIGLEAIYSGADLGSRQTAEYVADSSARRVRVSRGLRGVSLGLWEGQLVSDVRDRHQRSFEQWRRAPCSFTPPLAERMEAAFGRTGAALKKIMRRHRVGVVAIVAAPTVLALTICRIRGHSPDRVFEVVDRLDPVVLLRGDGVPVRPTE